MSDLNGKIAVVTGGNSGIGYASAAELKSRGATVVITGRNAERVATAAEDLGVLGKVADVTNLEAVDQLVADIKADFGKVDVLFINAGVYKAAPIGQTTEELYDYVMDINFKGAVFTLEKFLPILADGASVINLSSILADTVSEGNGIYSASKAALSSYSKTASIELAPRGIRVNTVSPGPIATPILEKTGLTQEQLEGFAAAIQGHVPLKRFGQAEEVAKLVGFLASSDAAYITGADFEIAGGIHVNTLMN